MFHIIDGQASDEAFHRALQNFRFQSGHIQQTQTDRKDRRLQIILGSQGIAERPLMALSGHPRLRSFMTSFGDKADIADSQFQR